ncbi:MAG: nuclear transport factor 2 family protein [Betaproteobacteria bacterium]
MRQRLLPVLAVLFLSVPISLAATVAPVASTEVMDVTQQACDAFRLRDLARLEKLLATEFVLVDSQGNVQSRAQNIDEVRAGDPVYEIFRNQDMSARIYGANSDAAVVQGITHVKGMSAGKTFEVKVRFTDTLVKRDGRWQIVVSHTTGLAAK